MLTNKKKKCDRDFELATEEYSSVVEICAKESTAVKITNRHFEHAAILTSNLLKYSTNEIKILTGKFPEVFAEKVKEEFDVLSEAISCYEKYYPKNGNGTVTDNRTGLVWLKNANCFGRKNWDYAMNVANDLASGKCGLSDGSQKGAWHLPNKYELKSLIDSLQENPALPSGHPFTNVQSGYYWSSTSGASGTSNALVVGSGYGYVDDSGKSYGVYVWPVRSGH